MSRVLAVYSSHYGQTEKIVRHLVDRWEREGHDVTLWQADRLPIVRSLAGFDAVLVAGSVELGRHQRAIRRFVQAHRAELQAVPSAFLSVCGALVGNWPDGAAESRTYRQTFEQETGWRPALSRSVAGAIKYRSYGWVTRWIMQRLMRRTGRPTDTSRDWEGTDWNAVDRIGDDLVASIPAVPAASY
ncbi:MAG: flavodoxin domain-containing protein [Gemmatimonadales bacterium]